jgi:hypothetical protein
MRFGYNNLHFLATVIGEALGPESCKSPLKSVSASAHNEGATNAAATNTQSDSHCVLVAGLGALRVPTRLLCGGVQGGLMRIESLDQVRRSRI